MPAPAIGLLAIAVTIQVLVAASRPPPAARAEDLLPPPAGVAFHWMKGFDRLPAAHLMTLYLQAFDNQPGISIPFLDLDYRRVLEWLTTVLALDPDGQYPLLMASQLYAQVPDPDRQRLMLDFVYAQFGRDPQRRWPWLAHAAIMAKHRLNDLPLALRYARAIAEQAKEGVPAWARQMHIFLLEDMGEYAAARILLGGLLASGAVTDTHERVLLLERLERLKAVEKSSKGTKP